MQVVRFCLVLLLTGLLGIQLAYAGTTGKIVGTIKDKNNGEPLIGADVVLEGTNLGSSTDPEGYFVIINVPPGNYDLTVHYIGYAPATVQNIRVSVDRTTTQHVELSVALVEGQREIIEAERPAIELDRTHSSAIVNAETVELMPVTTVEEVLELQAGVVSQNGELHFRGGRAREVTYIIDGIPVNNAFAQGGGNNVDVENSMIEELEIISGTFNAEYGQAQSGVVNIVTKRPADEFTGSVQVYGGDYVSRHNDIFIGIDELDPLSEKDVQFSLTGPIVKGKLGFVLSARHNRWENVDWYERRYNSIDGWRIAAYNRWFQEHNPDDANESGFINIPDSLKTGDGELGPLSDGRHSSLQMKFIYNPISEVTISYQAFGSYDEGNGIPDVDRLGGDRFFRYAPDNVGIFESYKHSHFLRIQHFPTENFFYNIAGSYQRTDGDFWYRKDNKLALYPGDTGIQPIGAAAEGFSLGNTGGLYGGDEGRNFQDTYLIQGDFNWQIDQRNLLKIGFLARQHWVDVYGRGFIATPEWNDRAFPLEVHGSDYQWEEYWDLLTLYWQNWETINDTTRFDPATPDLPNAYRDFQIKPRELAFYIQDKIEIEDIIVNAGVRLDIFDPQEVVPVNLRTESFNLGDESNLVDAEKKYQISPRLGISFPISSEGAFHASYGHFFQMPSFQFMFNEPLVSLNRFQLEGRTLGNANLEAEKTIAYEIGLQQALTSQLSVDITAYYKDFRNLLGIEQVTTIDNVQYRRYVNRDYGNSKGITLGFTKRGGMVTGSANYSLTFANGSSSDPGTLELINTATRIGGEDVVFPERKILSLDWDQRHTLNAAVNFSKSGNWSVGLVGYVTSGTPFDVAFVERFDLNEREYRQSGRIPTSWNVDLKAKKHLTVAGQKTAFFVKVDNIFDHLNHENVFNTTGRSDQDAKLPDELVLDLARLDQQGHFTYDETIINGDSFSAPRNIQFGMELKF